jgi:uncharacterized protein (TIGR02444 family)
MNTEEAWNFIVGRYQLPGQAEELLRRQDREGLDIVLHLFGEYLLASQGQVLDAAQLEEARSAIAAWRASVIQPLRAVRRLLKDAPRRFAVQPAPAEALRSLLKEAELRSERLQLELLCRWWEQRSGRP